MPSRKLLFCTMLVATLSVANNLDIQKAFEAKCTICHIANLAKMDNKKDLIAPPIDEVMTHIKEEFGSDKTKAVKFMAEYIIEPNPNKALCASIEYFGVMPPQKEIITPQEALSISNMMFDHYPRQAFVDKESKSGRDHHGMRFEAIDTNGDGVITAKEFQHFRALKNNIDPERFVNTYYFDRFDLNKDNKMDRVEFDKMKADKRRKKMHIQ